MPAGARRALSFWVDLRAYVQQRAGRAKLAAGGPWRTGLGSVALSHAAAAAVAAAAPASYIIIYTGVSVVDRAAADARRAELDSTASRVCHLQRWRKRRRYGRGWRCCNRHPTGEAHLPRSFIRDTMDYSIHR